MHIHVGTEILLMADIDLDIQIQFIKLKCSLLDVDTKTMLTNQASIQSLDRLPREPSIAPSLERVGTYFILYSSRYTYNSGRYLRIMWKTYFVYVRKNLINTNL